MANKAKIAQNRKWISDAEHQELLKGYNKGVRLGYDERKNLTRRYVKFHKG